MDRDDQEFCLLSWQGFYCVSRCSDGRRDLSFSPLSIVIGRDSAIRLSKQGAGVLGQPWRASDRDQSVPLISSFAPVESSGPRKTVLFSTSELSQ